MLVMCRVVGLALHELAKLSVQAGADADPA